MRTLIILRGPGDSGRASFAHVQGVSDWVIDQELIERILSEPVSDPQGNLRSDPHQRSRLRGRVLAMLEEKMTRGALIVFRPSDTGVPYARTTPSASDRMITSAIEMARKHRYRVVIVDFANQACATHIAARRDKNGGASNKIAIEREIAHMKRRVGIPVGDDITWVDAAASIDLLSLIEPKTIELDPAKNIVIIGDIHGCYKTLEKLTDGFEVRDDSYYIFLGDYINKGPESGRVLHTLLERFVPKSNCFFLTGNHERPLCDWVRGADIPKKAFLRTGLPSLEASGVTRGDARAFLDRCLDGARFRWRGLDILATHGGFARPPKRLAVLSTEHLQFGTDAAHFDADGAWEANVLSGDISGPARLIQVHGHRNPRGLPVSAGIGSFNLEDGIDRGGPLRALALSPVADADLSYRARAICIQNLDVMRREDSSAA